MLRRFELMRQMGGSYLAEEDNGMELVPVLYLCEPALIRLGFFGVNADPDSRKPSSLTVHFSPTETKLTPFRVEYVGDPEACESLDRDRVFLPGFTMEERQSLYVDLTVTRLLRTHGHNGAGYFGIECNYE